MRCMLQDNENKMRSLMDDIYFGKTRDIVGSLRTIETATDLGLKEKLAEEFREALISKGEPARDLVASTGGK